MNPQAWLLDYPDSTNRVTYVPTNATAVLRVSLTTHAALEGAIDYDAGLVGAACAVTMK